MIYVVDRKHEQIWNRCDAWECGGLERMLKWCEDNDWIVDGQEITPMGDMVIWVY